MPQTFDPGDFDIHEFERPGPTIKKVTASEKIDPRILNKIDERDENFETKIRGRKAFLAIVGNLFLPGLGNVIIKKSFLSMTLFSANLLLLALTLSPTSILGFVGGNFAYSRNPPGFVSSLIIAPGSYSWSVAPNMLPLFYGTVLMALGAWVHLAFLLWAKRKKSKTNSPL